MKNILKVAFITLFSFSAGMSAMHGKRKHEDDFSDSRKKMALSYVTHEESVDWKQDWDSELWKAYNSNNPIAMIRALIHGASPNSINEYGYPILFCAANNSKIGFMSVLLSFGADPNLQEESAGATALHAAVLGHSIEVVQLLVEYGADINYPLMFDSSTPLDAVEEGSEIYNFLKSKGAILGSHANNFFRDY